MNGISLYIGGWGNGLIFHVSTVTGVAIALGTGASTITEATGLITSIDDATLYYVDFTFYGIYAMRM